jgi:hypothetical protein
LFVVVSGADAASSRMLKRAKGEASGYAGQPRSKYPSRLGEETNVNTPNDVLFAGRLLKHYWLTKKEN